MNCTDFRHLIQRRFDIELPPQEDRSLLIHLETCDSCQNFYHQLQQVIIAAEELELSEDLLPEKPEELLNKILDNMPENQGGIKELVLSFLSRLGLGNIGLPTQGSLIPGLGTLMNKLTPVPDSSFDLTAEQSLLRAHAPQKSLFPEKATVADLRRDTSVGTIPATDQVTTRSLGQKFGISAVTRTHDDLPALSLAESIKQKISQMSKDELSYEATAPIPEKSVEPIDEWTVPHAPQWPKLNPDAPPGEWPKEGPGEKAPNTWGSATTQWNSQTTSETASVPGLPVQESLPEQIAVQGVSQEVQRQDVLPDSPTPKMEGAARTWSTQAEQMETGNWKMLQLDTTLGATSYPSSPPVTPAFSEQAQPQTETNNNAPSPKTSSVTSRWAEESITSSPSPSFANPSALAQPAVSSDFTLKSIEPKDSEATAPENPEDKSRLFNLDDGAIDKIFSANLGVHEPVVPAKSFQQETEFTEIQPSSQFQTKTGEQSAPAVNTEFTENMAKIDNVQNAAIQAEGQNVQLVQPGNLTSTDSAVGSQSKLMNIDDNLIDRIFSDALGVPDHVSNSVMNTSVQQTPVLDQHQVISSVSQSSTEPASSVEAVFAAQENQPVTEPEPLVAEAVTAQTTAAQETAKSADFSSVQAAPDFSSMQQRIAGVGKLDERNKQAAGPGSGRIASIGKFLLDNKDLEKIEKITAVDSNESKLRALTVEAYSELKALIQHIDAQDGVTGTIIVGHDGLLIANTVPQEMDPESLGVWALGMFMGTSHVTEKLGDENVRQIVSCTTSGYLIIANFGAGLLVTLTNPIMVQKLLPIMRTITQLVAA